MKLPYYIKRPPNNPRYENADKIVDKDGVVNYDQFSITRHEPHYWGRFIFGINMKDNIEYFRDVDGDIWKWKNRRIPVFIYFIEDLEFEYPEECLEFEYPEKCVDFKTANKECGLVKITKEDAFLEILWSIHFISLKQIRIMLYI